MKNFILALKDTKKLKKLFQNYPEDQEKELYQICKFIKDY
jgi:hypothetical protein